MGKTIMSTQICAKLGPGYGTCQVSVLTVITLKIRSNENAVHRVTAVVRSSTTTRSSLWYQREMVTAVPETPTSSPWSGPSRLLSRKPWRRVQVHPVATKSHPTTTILHPGGLSYQVTQATPANQANRPPNQANPSSLSCQTKAKSPDSPSCPTTQASPNFQVTLRSLRYQGGPQRKNRASQRYPAGLRRKIQVILEFPEPRASQLLDSPDILYQGNPVTRGTRLRKQRRTKTLGYPVTPTLSQWKSTLLSLGFSFN